MSAEVCSRCTGHLGDAKKRFALGNFYHTHCFLCGICHKVIDNKFLSTEPKPGRLPQPAHPQCVAREAGDVCSSCKDVILDEVIAFGNTKYHSWCLVCSRCGGVIEDETFGSVNDTPVHARCPTNPKRPERPPEPEEEGSPAAGPANAEDAYKIVIEIAQEAIGVTKERLQAKPSQALTQILTHLNRALHAAFTRCQIHVAATQQLSKEESEVLEKASQRKQHIVKLAWAARAAAAATQNEIAVVKEQLRRKEASAFGPVGDVTLIFTDVQGSTRLWETKRDPMQLALEHHHSLFRRLIRAHDAFEVKTEGDAFMVAFPSPISAVKWCVEAQLELLQQEWPGELLGDEDAAVEEVDASGAPLWRGLRVRMGGEYGNPICEQDPVTGRTDYYGPAVNLSARVCGKAVGGQILLGQALAAAVASDPWFQANVATFDHGAAALKGITGNVRLTSAYPKSLGPRRHAYLAKASLRPQEEIGGHDVGEKRELTVKMDEQTLVARSKELRNRFVELQGKYTEAETQQKQLNERAVALENAIDLLQRQLLADGSSREQSFAVAVPNPLPRGAANAGGSPRAPSPRVRLPAL